MSVAPHAPPSDDPARATTPATTSQSGTGWPKLARGEIPSTWSKPAEVVTTVPARAKGALPLGPIVGVVVALGTAAVVFVALPSRDAAVSPVVVAPVPAAVPDGAAVALASASPIVVTSNATANPSTATTSTAATATTATTATTTASASVANVDVAEGIPKPPPTSSTRPDTIAPEDQGGDANADAASAGDVVTELPARKKAKGLTARAIQSLRRGDVASAEPLLVRAVLVDPSFADAWRHLGIARAQLGDVEGARRAYRKYLELAPKAPDAAQVRAILAAP